MSKPSISPEVIDALRKYDSPTIANAVEKFEVRDRADGYASLELRCQFPHYEPMVGYAVTYTGDSTRAGETRPDQFAELLERVAAAPKPVVLVGKYVGQDRMRSLFGGEMVAATMQYLGVAGLVTDGGVRDCAGMAKYAPGYQVFCPGLVVSHGQPVCIDFDVTVDICGLTIRPGDLLHGDANGLLTVPLEIAEQLPPVAQKVSEVEKPLFEVLKTPNRPLDEVLRALSVH